MAMRTMSAAVIVMAACSSSGPGSAMTAPDAGQPDARAELADAATEGHDGMDVGTDARASTPDAAPSDAPRARTALILALSVYGKPGSWIVDAWNLAAFGSDAVVLAPDGSTAPTGPYTWNASASCCDDTGQNQDEAALVALVRARVAAGDIDPDRVWAFGHSNGAFMAYRLACDHADLFAGAVGYAGAAPSVSDQPCLPSQPISVLDVHGTADATVSYTVGGHLLDMPDHYRATVGADGAAGAVGSNGQPSSLGELATALGCADAPVITLGAHDVVATIPGAEADALVFPCTAGALEHWRVNGAGHVPALSTAWPADLAAWIADHRR